MTPAPEPVGVPADELAGAEDRIRHQIARLPDSDAVTVEKVHLRLLLREYDRRDEMCDVFEARWNEARADLARALPVVEAAGALVEKWERWCPSAPPIEFARLLDALARAVDAAREQQMGDRP